MRTRGAVILILWMSTAAWSQTTTPTKTAIFPSGYNVTGSLVDGNGNLIIFDNTAVAVPVTTNTTVISNVAFQTPKTRVTIVRPAGTPESVEYPSSSFQALGVGTQAVFAIMTIYSQVPGVSQSAKVIAILPNQTLPAASSGFASVPLANQLDVHFGAPDFISVISSIPVDPALAATLQQQITVLVDQINVLSAQLKTTKTLSEIGDLIGKINTLNQALNALYQQLRPTGRQSQVFRFNGTKFEQVGATAVLP